MLSHVLRTTDGSITSRLQRRAFEKILRLGVVWVEPHLDAKPFLPSSELGVHDIQPPEGVVLAAHELHPAPEALGKVPVGVVHAGTRRPLCNPFAETDDPSAETDLPLRRDRRCIFAVSSFTISPTHAYLFDMKMIS